MTRTRLFRSLKQAARFFVRMIRSREAWMVRSGERFVVWYRVVGFRSGRGLRAEIA